MGQGRARAEEEKEGDDVLQWQGTDYWEESEVEDVLWLHKEPFKVCLGTWADVAYLGGGYATD